MKEWTEEEKEERWAEIATEPLQCVVCDAPLREPTDEELERLGPGPLPDEFIFCHDHCSSIVCYLADCSGCGTAVLTKVGSPAPTSCEEHS